MDSFLKTLPIFLRWSNLTVYAVSNAVFTRDTFKVVKYLPQYIGNLGKSINTFTRAHFTVVNWGHTTLVPEALMQRELERQQKENSKAKGRASGLGRWESHFHVHIRFKLWTLLWLTLTVDMIWLVLYIKPVWPVTVEANQRQGSKSEPNTDMEVRFSTA